MISNMPRVLLFFILALYSVLVFVLDVISPTGIEVWVLNLPMIVVPVLFRSTRTVVVVSLACSAMVVVGSFYSPTGANPRSWDVLNRSMGLATMWLTAVMAIKIINDITRRKALEREIHRQELEREILEMTAREQRHIAQELHDGVGQELTGLGLMAQALTQRLPEAGSEQRIATRLVAGLNQLHQQIRALARGLLPVEVESKGLWAALDDLAAKTTEQSGVSVTFDCPGWVELPDHATSMELYRIAQEAVSNALRHGRPQTIRITILSQPSGLRLRIKDDGAGMPDQRTQSKGLGIRIMEYRADSIRGQLRIEPADEGGTMVTVTLPWRKANEHEETRSTASFNTHLDCG